MTVFSKQFFNLNLLTDMMLIVQDLLSMVPRQNLIMQSDGCVLYLFNTIVTQYQYLNMGFGSVNALTGYDTEERNRRRVHIQ